MRARDATLMRARSCPPPDRISVSADVRSHSGRGAASNIIQKGLSCIVLFCADNMDFLHTIKHLVEENDAAIGATQQAIMRLDFLLSRAFQKDCMSSENNSHELSLLFQERR